MTRKKKSRKKQQQASPALRYIIAAVLILLAIVTICQYGFVGIWLTNIVRFFVGRFYAVFVCMLLAWGIILLFSDLIPYIESRKIIAFVVLFVALMIYSAIPDDKAVTGMMVFSSYLDHLGEYFTGILPAQGGILGSLLFGILCVLFDRVGTYIVLFLMVIIFLLLLIDAETYEEWFMNITASLKRPRKVKKKKPASRVIESDEEFKETTSLPAKAKKTYLVEPEKKTKKSIFINSDEDYAEEEQVQVEPIKKETKTASMPKENRNQKAFIVDDEDLIEEDDVIIPVVKEKEVAPVVQKVVEPVVTAPVANTVVTPVKELVEEKDDENNGEVAPVAQKPYVLPPTSLLKQPSKARSNSNQKAAMQKGERLIEILAAFGIPAQLVDTHIGPAVTKFEIRPESTVKVSKILSIQDNIKMELVARDIRIEAPIPGKNAVGIEIPNVETTMVMMNECIQQIPEKKQGNKLIFVLGKDLMGQTVFCELNKMPHLLIAGATGSGKSVCMNTIISSILMRTKPDEVKLLLIDPKKVEFSQYKEIPHLIGPVISDGAEANRALKVIVEMMDQRYNLFSMCGVRNIAGYNEKLEKNPDEKLKPMPYVVVIIDELADLMLAAGKEVEQSIQRITQLARAAGIHLIVATQRPSVDVITGVIKSNIPSRIAFAVSSGTDSRTILDTVGADRLLGNGDMLYHPSGEPSPIRLQGVYMSDEEVADVANFCAKQQRPRFEDAFIRLEGVDNNEATSFVSPDNDPLYEEVKQFVIGEQKASTSLLQRRFGIGYNRAARLIDVLEEKGIIGPVNGSKPREVYIKKGAADYAEEDGQN